MFGLPYPPAQRLEVFRATVLAASRLTGPAAAWWPTAGQLLPPPSPGAPPLMGLVNVRLFRVEGSASDVVMDTLGLQVFGLPDLQCHCHEIELPRLAAYLRNAATTSSSAATSSATVTRSKASSRERSGGACRRRR